MSKPRAFIALPLPESVLKPVLEVAQVDAWKSGRAPVREDLLARVGEVEGIMGSALLPIDAGVLSAAPRLLVVSNFGVGFDNVDLAEATRRGVVVGNTPDILTDAVADLTLALILALARRLTEGAGAVHEGRWVEGFNLPLGEDLKGKTLSIVGMGRIGAAVAQRAAAFGMRIVYHDARDDAGAPVPAGRLPLVEALREADFLTLHVNLTPESRQFIGAAELALMKPTASLVNTARGAIVDQVALYDALRDGKIAGAALDVLDPEPPSPDDPLTKLPNVIITPHIGSATRETRRAMLELALRNLVVGLRGGLPERCVNPEALKRRRGLQKR